MFIVLSFLLMSVPVGKIVYMASFTTDTHEGKIYNIGKNNGNKEAMA